MTGLSDIQAGSLGRGASEALVPTESEEISPESLDSSHAGHTLVHMFVLGLDPGLTRTGFGVVQDTRKGPRAARVGVLSTDPKLPMPQRLAELADDLDALIAEVAPDVVALERVFVKKNFTNAMSVARASGVAMVCAARAGVALHEYTPSEVKLAVAGDGNADKSQVGALVARRLHLAEVPKPADAADALGVALCHLQQARFGAAAS